MISSGAVQENEMETLLRHLKLFHLKHNESKTYHISRRDLDNFRFLQVPPHLLTLAVQVKTAPCVSRWYKTCETSSIRCQYQATVAARIGFANSQNHCIRICMNLYPVELCAFACLGALNHDRPIIAYIYKLYIYIKHIFFWTKTIITILTRSGFVTVPLALLSQGVWKKYEETIFFSPWNCYHWARNYVGFTR